jgi:Domain of unknown function (DUF4267)
LPSDIPSPGAFRTIGFWMAAIIAAFLALNTARAILNPIGFSAYFGAPLASDADAAWVIVYALRTGLLAFVIGLLLITRELRLLGWVALAGAALPVADFVIAQAAGAPTPTLARHAAIGVFLVLTGWRLLAAPRAS